MLKQRNFIIISLVFGGSCTAILLYFTGLSVSLDLNFAVAILSAFAGILSARFYRPCGHERFNQFVLVLECLGYLSLASLISGIASYPLSAISQGWWDHQFLAADAAMGFDWKAYWDFSTSHPILLYIYSWAYGSFFLMPTFVVIALVVTRKLEDAYKFISAFIIALLITDICAALFPARSAAANLLPAGAPLAPPSGLLHIPVIEGLRDGSVKVVNVLEINGLIALPSFHAAASLLFAWAGWKVRGMRMPFLIANGLMLASTPIIGGHYFIDVLAGLLVAGMAIYLSHALSLGSTSQRNTLLVPQTA